MLNFEKMMCSDRFIRHKFPILALGLDVQPHIVRGFKLISFELPNLGLELLFLGHDHVLKLERGEVRYSLVITFTRHYHSHQPTEKGLSDGILESGEVLLGFRFGIDRVGWNVGVEFVLHEVE